MWANFNNSFSATFSDELQKKICYEISHHTSNLLPHYLEKNECSTAHCSQNKTDKTSISFTMINYEVFLFDSFIFSLDLLLIFSVLLMSFNVIEILCDSAC